MILRNNHLYNYRIALAVSLCFAFVAALFVIAYGKLNSFLLLNGFHHTPLDYFFNYYTYFGDGYIWVPLFLFILIFKRNYFIAALASLLICTFFTHFLKRVIFPNDLRPVEVIDHLHIIKGLYIERGNSFPSGHTSTAFTIALLFVFIINKKWTAFVFPFLALGVAYSRVYLSQHFVTDVVGGMLVGTGSSFLSIWLYQRYLLNKRFNSHLNKI